MFQAAQPNCASSHRVTQRSVYDRYRSRDSQWPARLQRWPVHLASSGRCWVPSLRLDPDTAVSHPSVGSWRTGGLQGTLLPLSLLQAALGEWLAISKKPALTGGAGEGGTTPQKGFQLGARWELLEGWS